MGSGFIAARPVEQPVGPALLILLERIGFHRPFIACDAGIGRGQFHQRHRRRAKRQAGIILGQRRPDPEIARFTDHRTITQLAEEAHRGDVARLGEGFFQANGAAIAFSGVFGKIAAPRDRRVVDHVVRLHARAQRRQPDKQLECGAGLALGLGDPVERGFCIVPATDHGHDLAVRAHRDQCDLRLTEWRACHDSSRDFLQARVQSRGQSEFLVAEIGQRAGLRHRPVGKIGAGGQAVPGPDIQSGDAEPVGFRLAQIAGTDHRGLDQIGPLGRQFRVAGRCEPGRGLNQSGEHDRLFERQVFRLAVVVMQRRGAQAIDIVAKIDVREVSLENFILGQPCLQPESDQHFPRLARQAAFRGQEGGLGELLGDRAAALGHAAAGEIAPQRPRETARIDAPVRIEAPVLDRQEGLRDMVGQFGDADRLVDHRSVAGERLSVGGQQRDLRRGDRLQRFGQRRGDREIGDDQDEGQKPGSDYAAGPPPFPARLFERCEPLFDARRDGIAIRLVIGGSGV